MTAVPQDPRVGTTAARRLASALALVAVAIGLGACDGGNDDNIRGNDTSRSVSGQVQSAGVGLSNYVVSLYQAGSGSPQELASEQVSNNGQFELDYQLDSGDDEAVYYLVAANLLNGTSGRVDIKLATALGTAPEDDLEVVINERTTVATGYAMAQFIRDGGDIGGSYPGLQNSAATVQNLANIGSGAVGDLLASEPNGTATSTMPTFNSLANMLAACIEAQLHCRTLVDNALSLRGAPPVDTLEAMRNVARNPWQNVDELFLLSQESTAYTPHLQTQEAPAAWTLVLRYIGDGPEGQKFDGPGNMAFDADGNAWVINNYEYSLNPAEPNICGSRQVMKLTPTGGTPPGAPYGDGGLYGAGFGVTIDDDGNVWIGNFGFQGASCSNDFLALSQSLSKFAPDGEALSDSQTGIMIEGLSMPQGMNTDVNGNIWVAGCTSNNVMKLPDADPDRVENFDNLGLQKPFDVASDARGHIWVTSNETGTVVELDNDGNQVGATIAAPGIIRPMGIASDSEGNIWVSNSGVLDPPCPTPSPDDLLIRAVGDDGELNDAAGVTFIRPNGEQRTVTTFGRTLDGPTRRGLRLPWGIAVDGNDNVFVANFAGQRLMILCGVKEEFCPPGTATGDAWGNEDGYPSDALKRVTGIQVDPSGNVWLVNNWIIDAFENIGQDDTHQNNPGEHSVAVFIGLAAPVKTPLRGQPSRP